MHKNLKEILQKSAHRPVPNLNGDIWLRIALMEKRRTRIRVGIFTLLGASSLFGLVPTLEILMADLSRSGFYEYFSLLFGNGKDVIFYWKELAFSMADSLPTMSIVLTLSFVFVFFLSLRYIARELGVVQSAGFTRLSI